MKSIKRISLAVVALGLTAAAAVMPEYAEAANGLRRASYANGL